MDLENFFDLYDATSPSPSSDVNSARQTIEEFDRDWYIPASRAARWMDLLGDYAGNETFIIDGESLLAIILDDPLLAIGRENECSFQILHAYHSLEWALLQFTQRSANFEVVFWNVNRHSTLLTGQSPFKVASRSLGRILLFRHLLTIDSINVHTFQDLEDPLWVEYEAAKKPMFMMVNDGGVVPNSQNDLAAERVLAQRIFIFDVLSRGTSIALLKDAEYRDSKILSFVHEQRRNRDHRGRFSDEFWTSVSLAKVSLDRRLDDQCFSFESHTLSAGLKVPSCSNRTFLRELAQKYFSKAITGVPPELLYLFITHCAILPNLSARDRARQLEELNPALVDIVTNSFLRPLFFVTADLVVDSNTSLDIDGRVFASLIRFCVKQPVAAMSDLVGSTVYELVESIWSDVKGPPLDFLSFAARFPLPSDSAADITARQVEPFHLLPFGNQTFNDELSAVRVPVANEEEIQLSTNPLDFDNGGLFSDTQHWHNQKAILPSHMGGGSAPKPIDERRRRRELRSNQRFMATLQTQAATLTGASGAILQQIIIAPVGTKQASKPPAINRSRPAKESKTGKMKASKLSSADKLRQKINEEKLSSDEVISQKWWRDQLSISAKMTLSEKVAHIKSLSRSKKMGEKFAGSEIRLYRLHLEFLQWIEEPERDADSVRDKYTVSILRMVKDICDQRVFTPSTAKALTAALLSIGFGDYATELIAPIDDSSDRKLNFDFIKLVKSKSKSLYHDFMSIKEHPVEWQLRVFGEFMDRSMDSAPDRRVAFAPDAWQRRVLDCIDEDQSLLVVAPTSAGKTFISYYAMEKVLRDSDDGILVYVAPTKALVSQIAAEVYARFSKSLNGKSCWAIHTRDYRVHDPQKCQILVTVPEMLAIMLLSPPLARVWTSRIKRIILDEIHSIGQQEGGAVWEQIILLAPCPIIGLSATIGSPEIFNEWLKTVQEAHGFQHKFIEHPHRYSHLRKFFYTFNGQPQFQSLDTYKASSRARFLHPISVLSFGARSLPKDLSLESRDVLDLYHAMVPYQDSIDRNLKSLDPAVFFSRIRCLLRQKDVLEYEAELKAILSSLLASHDPKDATSPLNGIIRRLQDSVICRTSSDELNVPPSRDAFRKNLIFLLADLHVKGELPAILFNFDRADCEIMAQDILMVLQDTEEKWRASSSEWQRKIRQWENWKLRSKERERQVEKEQKQKKDKEAGAESANTTSWENSFDPLDPIEQFSFAGARTSYSKVDLDRDVEEIAKWTSTPTWALDALRRGIAVHHSGMNKRYRSLVESLFRVGFVRVVIATGTLALGINAPAKTSVFCGDSPFLTALMYRQCAGRAGRRGFDLLGNVVFYGLPLERVQRLVLSRLPSLSGNFPLTSTLTLRLLNLLEGSSYAPVAVKAVRSIMALPHISFGSEVGRHQLLHHLRFSIEYLRRSRLVDKEGKPMNLFAIAAHLYYTEPSNLALVALLRNGILHQICQQPNFVLAKREFILLMCHLFGRRYLSKVLTNQRYLEPLIKKYPSAIVLPALSEGARGVLVQHDQEILRIFTGYAIAYGTEYGAHIGPECRLPLSGVEFSGCDEGAKSRFHSDLSRTAILSNARSVFVAGSGHDDKFDSVSELASTARDGLHLNAHAIPSMEHLTRTAGDRENNSLEHVLNAYLLDFYTHGQAPTLAVANGIRRGDVWYLLQDFALSLATVKAALEQLLLKSSKEAASKKVGEQPEEELGDENGYTSLDPADRDQDDEGGNLDDDEGFKRPLGVADEDWKVYEVVREALKEFDQKFRAMWA